MNDRELETLWDPRERAGVHTRALEERLRPLRRAGEPPPLSLPERQEPKPPERAGRWVLVAAAAAALLLVSLLAWSRGRVEESKPSVEIAQRSPVTLVEPDLGFARADAWRVASLGEQANCKDPRVQTGAELFDWAELHTGESVTVLSAGAARVELHPHSAARYVDGTVALVTGRAWAELPARVDAKPWRLYVGELEVQAVDARFVASVDSHAGVIEVEVSAGAIRIGGGGALGHAEAGETCRASVGPGPVELIGPIECQRIAARPSGDG